MATIRVFLVVRHLYSTDFNAVTVNLSDDCMLMKILILSFLIIFVLWIPVKANIRQPNDPPPWIDSAESSGEPAIYHLYFQVPGK